MEAKQERVKSLLVLVNVVAVILLIIGIVQAGRAIFKTVAFDKYPLNSYEMTTTNNDGKTEPLPADQVEIQQKLRMMEDYASTLSLLLVAGGMFWVNKKYTKYYVCLTHC